MADGARIRPAREEEAAAVAALLHETAVDMYERFAGHRESALRTLEAAFRRSGTGASREVVRVVDAGGAIAAAMAAFPAGEVNRRGSRFLRLLLARTPPWTWVRSIRLHRLGGRLAPPPPADSLYVDALAVAEEHRRRGLARMLLADAERSARELGLASVALETGLGNAAARALYESAGFEEGERREPRDGLPGFVAYVKPVR
ncbi:MAG TPA: GNAT family N-acetyltransferase [Thermoleophilaceae bacterium]